MRLQVSTRMKGVQLIEFAQTGSALDEDTGTTSTTLCIFPDCPGCTTALDCSLRTTWIIQLMESKFLGFCRALLYS